MSKIRSERAQVQAHSMSNRAGSGDASEFLPAELEGAYIVIALKCVAADHAIYRTDR